MKKIYVAGPFFNKKEIKIMKSIKELLLSANLGYDFFFPMDHFIPNGDKLSNSDWCKKVFEMDVTELLTSNYVFAVYNGMYSDTSLGNWICLWKKYSNSINYYFKKCKYNAF